MRLAYGFFATAAEVLPDGRFFVFGAGWDAVKSSTFPAIIPSLYLFVRIAGDPNDYDLEHDLRLRVMSPSGMAIIETPISNLPKLTQLESPDRVNYYSAALSLLNCALEIPGQYAFEILVDGIPLGSVILYAKLTEASGKQENADA